MYCSKCGKEVKKEWKFCNYCGNDLSNKNGVLNESNDIEKNNLICPKCGREMEEITGNGFRCKHCTENKDISSKILNILKIISLVWFGLICWISFSGEIKSINEFVLNLFGILLFGGFPYIIIKSIINYKNKIKNTFKKINIISGYICLLFIVFIIFCATIEDNDNTLTNTLSTEDNYQGLNEIDSTIQNTKTDKQLYDELVKEAGKIIDESRNSIFPTNENGQITINNLDLESVSIDNNTGVNFMEADVNKISIYIALKDDKIDNILLFVEYNGEADIRGYKTGIGSYNSKDNYEGSLTYEIDINNYSQVIFCSDYRWLGNELIVSEKQQERNNPDYSGGGFSFDINLKNGAISNIMFARGNRAIDVTNLK